MATSAVEATQGLLQTETRVQRSYRELQRTEQRTEHRTEQRTEHRVEQHTEQHSEQRADSRNLKKKKSTRRHNDEGSISVSKSSEKLQAKLKASADGAAQPECAACGRPVYQMERIKAERRSWHRDCFRCCVCRKQLTVETYESEQTALYCRPHFRQLFEPTPAADTANTNGEPAASKKHELIVCESNPAPLPPDVVRASDAPALGLEELAQLDVRSRFEMFERGAANPTSPTPPAPAAPRGTSHALLSKIAKFKARGMDVGVPDECLAGVPVDPSSSEPDDDDEDSVLRRSYAACAREQPVPAANLGELRGRFEPGADAADSQRHRDRKQEIQNIRSRLFMGKQARIKEMYEQSVLQSEQGVTSSRPAELEAGVEGAREARRRWEQGAPFAGDAPRRTDTDINDPALFDRGIGKQSRSIFQELDAQAKGAPPLSPPPNEPPRRKEMTWEPREVVRAGDRVEEVRVDTADISDRFRFFETYQPQVERRQFRMTPPRGERLGGGERSPSPEPYHEPGVARSEPAPPDTGLAATRQTATRMINVFRDLEHRQNHAQPADPGPKPLKRFTPPPPGETTHRGDSSETESGSGSDSEEERWRLRRATQQRDEALQQAQQVCRTRSFRDRFERGPSPPTPAEVNRAPPPFVHNGGSEVDGEEDGESQLETARSLRDKFESMRVRGAPVSRANAPPNVRRFV